MDFKKGGKREGAGRPDLMTKQHKSIMNDTKPGAALAALRKKINKTCPICGAVFEGYANTGETGCKSHAGTVRQRQRRERLRE